MELEDEDSGSSCETASESDESIVRPTFIPKNQRITLTEGQRKKNEDSLRDEKKRLEEELRKSKTRAFVAENVRRIAENVDVQNKDGYDSEFGMPDCEDEKLDDDIEYEAWKLREIKRLKRDTEEREMQIIEKADVLRRRSMTDEERRKEDELDGKFQVKEKPKMKFLQKYYHKGVFYMDVDSIKDVSDVRAKDYVAPTLGDHVDKEKLPQILQVKNFGKRGRTKYTHLVDQDTTLKDNKRVDSVPHRAIMDKYYHKMGGLHG